MEIFRKEIDGNKFTFVCETWETSRAWGHKCTIFPESGFSLTSAKVRYYNRTWESYRFQSVCKQAVYNLLTDAKEQSLNTYRDTTGRKRLTATEKADIWAGSQTVKMYSNLLNAL